MKRHQLFELEDLPWWPRVFRDAMTDYLAAAVRFARIYDVFAPRLAAALARSGTREITDLCAGGGGPWRELLPALRGHGADVAVCLTDRFPNPAAWSALAREVPGVRSDARSVDASAVPADLDGFRTLFASFHHFPPDVAREILAAAVRDRRGIAVFEGVQRSPAALAAMVPVALAVWLLTPAIRPFRWSRLFWTYVVPVIPLAVLFDGVVSCLRVYTPDELAAMAREVGGDIYEWEIGEERPRLAPLPLPYLIGVPRRPEAR